jgi:hypothetical protein
MSGDCIASDEFASLFSRTPMPTVGRLLILRTVSGRPKRKITHAQTVLTASEPEWGVRDSGILGLR